MNKQGTTEGVRRQRQSPPLAGRVVLGVIYYIAARLSLLLAYGHSNTSPVWPPSGIALTGLLLLGWRTWPGIWLGAFAANVVDFFANHAAGPFAILWVSALIACGNSLEALVGWWLLDRQLGPAGKEGWRGPLFGKVYVFQFAIVAVAMCLASACIGPVAICAAGIVPWDEFARIGFTWWLGDASGVLILTPFLLAWAGGVRLRREPAYWLESALAFVVLGMVSWAIFGSWTGSLPVSYLAVAPLVWIAARLGPRSISTALVLLSAIAVWQTIHAFGPHARPVENQSLFGVLGCLWTLTISALALENTVSARRAAEASLRELTTRLERRVEERTVELNRTVTELARSNTELERFAYVASHDLQEPLRAIVGCIEILEKDYRPKLDSGAGELIRHAVEGAKRMQILINDLLAYSRLGTRGEPFERVDCDVALNHAIANLGVAIRESDALVTHDPLPTLVADPTQLPQLFQNLIANGIKFCAGRRPAIHIGAQPKNDGWLFSVRDNGIGIDPQYHERIFVIFQRLHNRTEYPGTGIGLALCKRIVERHGGQISVESTPGEGSTFYFSIPQKGNSN